MGEESKHHQIYTDLKASLAEGRYRDGERLPTELELAASYGVSRPTVTKALNSLKKEGLVTRRTGSGTYASLNAPGPAPHQVFGLLIPGLGRGEIFEPICARIAALSEEKDFALLWGGAACAGRDQENNLEQVVRRFLANHATGVFFAPLELNPEFEGINLRLVSLLAEARLPTVLIDTDYLPFPLRGRFDLVGIDNFQAGYTMARHLLEHGRGRVDFLYRPHSSHTVPVRLRGFQAALWDAGVALEARWVHCGDPEDGAFVQEGILGSGAADIVCGNDETAARLMSTLDRLGVRIPEQARIVGFDDVHYAQHLRVPLTTYHQPCPELGSAAVETMLARIRDPLRAPRTITVPGSLVVRGSCGDHPPPPGAVG
jgi:GntR family transcriptional regulator of arabinose operon